MSESGPLAIVMCGTSPTVTNSSAQFGVSMTRITYLAKGVPQRELFSQQALCYSVEALWGMQISAKMTHMNPLWNNIVCTVKADSRIQ